MTDDQVETDKYLEASRRLKAAAFDYAAKTSPYTAGDLMAAAWDFARAYEAWQAYLLKLPKGATPPGPPKTATPGVSRTHCIK